MGRPELDPVLNPVLNQRIIDLIRAGNYLEVAATESRDSSDYPAPLASPRPGPGAWEVPHDGEGPCLRAGG